MGTNIAYQCLAKFLTSYSHTIQTLVWNETVKLKDVYTVFLVYMYNIT